MLLPPPQYLVRLVMNYKNKALVDKLVKQHSSALLRFLTRRMKSREDAEDIAQATFLRLYTLDNLDHLSNAKAFLFQVAANMSIDQMRREVLHKNYIDREVSKQPRDLSAMATVAPEGISLERELQPKETLRMVHNSLSELPQNVRQAFILSRSKGWTYGQIAKQQGVSVSSVEKYILEALKQLRGAVDSVD